VKSLLATRRKGPVDEAHRRAELAPANDHPEASGGFDNGMHTRWRHFELPTNLTDSHTGSLQLRHFGPAALEGWNRPFSPRMRGRLSRFFAWPSIQNLFKVHSTSRAFHLSGLRGGVASGMLALSLVGSLARRVECYGADVHDSGPPIRRVFNRLRPAQVLSLSGDRSLVARSRFLSSGVGWPPPPSSCDASPARLARWLCL
jgi:hypothetical protein